MSRSAVMIACAAAVLLAGGGSARADVDAAELPPPSNGDKRTDTFRLSVDASYTYPIGGAFDSHPIGTPSSEAAIPVNQSYSDWFGGGRSVGIAIRKNAAALSYRRTSWRGGEGTTHDLHLGLGRSWNPRPVAFWFGFEFGLGFTDHELANSKTLSAWGISDGAELGVDFAPRWASWLAMTVFTRIGLVIPMGVSVDDDKVSAAMNTMWTGSFGVRLGIIQ